jgi:hypothetical protein
MMAELLSMIDVCVSYGRQDRRIQILRNVSLDVAAAVIAGIASEEDLRKLAIKREFLIERGTVLRRRQMHSTIRWPAWVCKQASAEGCYGMARSP